MCRHQGIMQPRFGSSGVILPSPCETVRPYFHKQTFFKILLLFSNRSCGECHPDTKGQLKTSCFYSLEKCLHQNKNHVKDFFSAVHNLKLASCSLL